MKYLLCLVIPITLLINIGYNDKEEFEQDPNYIYLFNGLNFATLKQMGHYDNPGTPVSEISAVIMRITYMLRKTEDNFSVDVIKNPQYYIKIIVRTFAFINSILIFLLGYFILKKTNELIYCLLFQTIPFLSGNLFSWFFETLSPEPLILGIVILFVIFFLWKFFFKKDFGIYTVEYSENQILIIDRFLIIFGILMGLCLATKINTMPLILLPLIFITPFKNKVVFLTITFTSFIIFTLPISHLYNFMISWYLRIITHTELYGGGTMGLIDFPSFYSNFLKTINSEPILMLIILISILVLIPGFIRRKYDGYFKILLSLVVVQLADIFMVFKHFNLHYLIPIIPTLVVNLFIIMKLFRFSQKLKTVIVISFITISIFLNKDVNKNIPRVYQINLPPDGLNVYSYKCKSPIYALKFGDDRSRNMNSEILQEVYGNQYFHEIAYNKFYTWKDTISLDSLFRINKTVYLHALDRYMQEFPPPFDITFLAEGTYIIGFDTTISR